MKLLHIERHTTCLNYVSDYNICFIHQRLFSGGDFKIDNHHHSCILFLLKGEILTSCSEFHDQHIVEGHMVLFPQNDPNQSKSMTETEFILLFFDNQVNLHNKMSIELSAIHLESEKSCFYSLSICPPLRHVLDSICFYLKQKVQCSHMHELKQKEIFMVFGTFYNRTDMAHFLMPITGRDPNFKSFVLENYLQIRNIKQFAQLYHCSERSFNRKFKSCFHDTPYNWILNQKTRHIKGQLANRNIPISEIARTFHFASPSHFTTCCKKRLGITPSEFREKIAK